MSRTQFIELSPYENIRAAWESGADAPLELYEVDEEGGMPNHILLSVSEAAKLAAFIIENIAKDLENLNG